VLFGVSHHSFFGMPSRVDDVCPRCVGVVRRLLVKSALVMFGCFPMVMRSICEML
jgi:hypothetical protein